MPTVSIIIPAYNQDRYLGSAIQSALDQTYLDTEIIVVNDGSTDSTAEVIGSFRDPRIIQINQSNQGLSSARNTGLRSARGTYVAFLDADDIFLPENIELGITEFKNTPRVGLVAGQTILMDENGKRLRLMSEKVIPQNPVHLLLGNSIHPGSVLMRREWFEKIGYFDESLRACEDWDMWLRLIRAGGEVKEIPKPVSMYRVHTGQMTRGAQRMRTASMAVLDKIFQSSPLPAGWQDLRDRAYAAALVKAAAREFFAGQSAEGRQDLSRAVQLDSGLLADDAAPLANMLAGWAESPMVEDPLEYLRAVYHGLPGNLFPLQKRYRRDYARLSMQLAFDSYQQGHLSKARHYILQAALHRPAWLANVGVLTILVRSFT